MPILVLLIMAVVIGLFINYPFFLGTVIGGIIWAYPAIRRRRFRNEYGPLPYETPEELPEFFHIQTKNLTKAGMILCLGTFFLQLPKVITDGQENAQIAEQERTAQAERTQKDKAASLAKDEADARSMGLSYDDYIKAKDKKFDAHFACQSAVLDSASWSGAKRHWIPDYSWSISGDIITINGHDISMKNGFGGEKEVSYRCSYDISSKRAIPTNVD